MKYHPILKIGSFLLLLALTIAPGYAHKPSDSYLTLKLAEQHSISGRWDIALRDLEVAIGLDMDGDAQITWGELRKQSEAIKAYALSRLVLKDSAGQCLANIQELMVDEHVDGNYAVLLFNAHCINLSELNIQYQLLFDIDPSHQGIVSIEGNDDSSTYVLSLKKSQISIAPGSRNNRFRQFLRFIGEGIWHIWIGLDHLLFLACLLLPSVMRKQTPAWVGVDNMGDALKALLVIVTAFTIAHSITLTLSVLGWVVLPSRPVEVGIAASIIVIAVFNLVPTLRSRWRHDRWTLAFAFGLLHGFGFAGVLMDIELPTQGLLVSLAGFNLGVEIGQVAVVAAIFPIAFHMRNSRLYKLIGLNMFSLMIIPVACWWLYERALLS